MTEGFERIPEIDVKQTMELLLKLPTPILMEAKRLHANNMLDYVQARADIETFILSMDAISLGIEDELYARLGGNDKLLGGEAPWTPPKDDNDE